MCLTANEYQKSPTGNHDSDTQLVTISPPTYATYTDPEYLSDQRNKLCVVATSKSFCIT